MPADAAPPIPPALDQLREQSDAAPGEVPCLLERVAQVPDPRDPRGVRYTPAVVLTLTACAVLAGATSLRAGTRTRTRTRHFAALRPASLEHQLGGAK